MLLFISKFVRIIKKDIIPTTCYAYQLLPYSLPYYCDCDVICKFSSKGKTHILISDYNTNPNNRNFRIV